MSDKLLVSKKFWIRHTRSHKDHVDNYELECYKILHADEYNKISNIKLQKGETQEFQLVETKKNFGKIVWILCSHSLASYTTVDLVYVLSNKKMSFYDHCTELLDQSFIEYSLHEFHEIFGMQFEDMKQRKFELIAIGNNKIKSKIKNNKVIVSKQIYRNFIIRKD